ncbi:MAG: transglutaminase [Alphaproteobacteria bacterium]|nr:transglutaminase [Alphaproteobacteria bacterium]
MRVIGLLLKGVFWALVVCVPLLGVWVGSSLAAFRNGPILVTALAGLLFFPILPLLWEMWAAARRARGPRAGKPRLLTFGDRMILRTLALNLVFIGGLLATWPEAGFIALNARGDWMLEGREGPEVEQAREVLFAAAEGLEWVYDAAHENPYAQLAEGGAADEEAPDQAELPGISGLDTTGDGVAWADPEEGGAATEGEPADEGAADEAQDDGSALPEEGTEGAAPDEEGSASPEEPYDFTSDNVWPSPEAVHPLVARMPPEAEASIAAVAAFIQENEPDPFLRVKALHDYVADRISYDYDSLVPGQRAPQDAVTVFETRRGVCAGYANLLAALGDETGDEIVYVVGNVRGMDGGLMGSSHAWNAARVDGRWYLMDPTWDSGYRGEDGAFVKQYRTDFLFTPPDVFVLDHRPDEDHWQLLMEPISSGDFIRQPMLEPGFFAMGLRMIAPTRPQLDVSGTVELRIHNPDAKHLLVDAVPEGAARGTRCTTIGRESLKVKCVLKDEATYNVRLFANDEAEGSYRYVGQVSVNNQPG